MKAKIKFFIILLAFFTSTTHAQNTSYQHLDTLVNDFVKELQANYIDTICIFRNYCVGCIHVFDNDNDKCNYSSIYIPTYIIWLKQGRTFLTQKDNCFDYSTIEIDSIFLWNFFFKNQNYIKKEKVKPFEYITCENHKKKVYSVLIDHSKNQDFKMIINKRVLDMHFNEFDLKEEYDGSININYLYNQKLKSKKIVDELTQFVQNIEDKQRLTKSKR